MPYEKFIFGNLLQLNLNLPWRLWAEIFHLFLSYGFNLPKLRMELIYTMGWNLMHFLDYGLRSFAVFYSIYPYRISSILDEVFPFPYQSPKSVKSSKYELTILNCLSLAEERFPHGIKPWFVRLYGYIILEFQSVSEYQTYRTCRRSMTGIFTTLIGMQTLHSTKFFLFKYIWCKVAISLASAHLSWYKEYILLLNSLIKVK